MTFPFRPRVKQRPRLGRRGKAYTPAETKQFEQRIRNAWDFPPIDGPVNVEVHLYKDKFRVVVKQFDGPLKSSLRGDIDNYAKAILDGLNRVAYTDDSKIRRLYIYKYE
jgi:Holliday junction resolvase RusA-like endonuclease